MYSILIVDDEKMIRNGIKATIPWSKIGIGRVYLAAEGKQALEIFKDKQPDILLTDIRMSQMSGIELIQNIRKTNINMRILVLTGYDNFEHAQQCLRLQVQDFILKPVDEAKLMEVLSQQVALLDEERQNTHSHRLKQRVQSMHEQIHLEDTLRAALKNQINGEKMQNLLSQYSYHEGQPIQMALFAPVPEADGKDLWDSFLVVSLKNLCIDFFDSRKQGITFEDEEGRIAVAVLIHEEFDEVYDRMEQLRRLIKNECGVKTRMALGSAVAGVEQLATSYHDAKGLLKNAEGRTETIYQTGQAERRLRSFSEVFSEVKRSICCNVADAEKTLQAFGVFEKNVFSCDLSNSYVRRCCFELAASYYYVFAELTENGVDNRLNALLVSLQGSGREDACRLTRSFFEQFAGAGKDDTHEIVATAQQFIRDHLAQELSVSNIARQLYVNATYLSRLFKKNTGEGCNEYLVRKRVEKAKSLLENTNYKTGEIAGMVGYRDANYFSLAFKKIAGMSPTSFRSSLRK